MPGPFEIPVVHDNTLMILHNSIENSICINGATRAAGLIKGHRITTYDDNMLESRPMTPNSKYVVGKAILHVIRNDVTKYVVCQNEYPPKTIPQEPHTICRVASSPVTGSGEEANVVKETHKSDLLTYTANLSCFIEARLTQGVNKIKN